MDADRFDALTRAVTAPRTRRTTLAGLAAGALLALGLALDEAPVRGKPGKGKKKCPQGKVRCGGRCRECCRTAQCAPFGPLHTCHNHRCTECASDADCTRFYAETTPFCLDRQTCVECRTSADCPPDRPGCIGNQCFQHCGDGFLNGDESDVDCGGRCPSKCPNGRGCFDATDCQSAICVNGKCRECEVDLDCPGSKPVCSGQGECVRCASDAHCSWPTPACHNQTCVACTEDGHCTHNVYHTCQGNRCVLSCPAEQPVPCNNWCWPVGTVCCSDGSSFGGEICLTPGSVCYALEPGQRPSLCCLAEWLCSPHECRPGGCD